ncbi:uncharacterized protein LOC126654845 [Mercurialis annua]|uniref:uncharacterized protein LOC126654845 n=1 Tax=Mercurialis annua TaxID=3986 RepID=UPI002160E0D4|nr:uncharacterized protein LOC126654845 [Mercurialis annua]
MSKNCNVYVSALYTGTRVNKSSSTSDISIHLKVSSSYVSDVTVPTSKRHLTLESLNRAEKVATEIESSCTEKSFLVPCHSLLSEDDSSLDFVSKMISDMNISFSLDKLHWRASPRDDWIPFGDRDDVVREILSLARGKASAVSTADQPKKLSFLVGIKRKIMIPHHEFEAMANARETELAGQEISDSIAWINQQPIPDRIRFLRLLKEHPKYNCFETLIEGAVRDLLEHTESKQIPASQSSIEALQEVIFDGDDDDTVSSCIFCMENLVISSPVTVMPCKHKFHKTCIVNWLERSHVCPLCRFELPTAP